MNCQNVEIELLTECACVADGRIWFFMYNHNSLNWYDIATGNMGSAGNVPWEPIDGKRLFSTIINHEDKIILIPYHGEYLTIYDIKTNTFFRNTTKLQLSSSIKRGNEIYMIPATEEYGTGIWRYKIEQNELDEIVDLSYIRSRNGLSEIWVPHMGIDNDQIVFCFGLTDVYVTYSINDEEITWKKIPGNIKRCYGMVEYYDNLLAVDFDKPRCVLFSKSGDLLEDIHFGVTFSENKDKYFNLFKLGNNVILNYIFYKGVFEISNKNPLVYREICSEDKMKYVGQAISAGDDFLILPTTIRRSWLFGKEEIQFSTIPVKEEVLKKISVNDVISETIDSTLKQFVKII